MDRYGRKLSETTGVIYISPANDDDIQHNRIKSNRLTDESMIRKYLLDPTYNGFFYRTDASVIEQWQLWDDDDINGSRPHPPASPFGLHEGLYHDDTTHEIQRYLRHMDEDEKQSCSCATTSSSKSKSSVSTSSASTEYSRKPNRSRTTKSKPNDDTDQFNASFSNLQTSSFEPISPQKTIKNKKPPIIIEKVVPKPISSIPILNPKLPQPLFDIPAPIPESHTNYHTSSDLASISYEINERGEKITKEGNRIVFMDVVPMNRSKKPIDLQSSSSTRVPRSHRQKSTRPIPIINVQSIEKLFHEKNSPNQRRSTTKTGTRPNEQHQITNHLTTADQFEIVEQYFEGSRRNKSHSTETTIDSILSSNNQGRKPSLKSSTNSSKSEKHHRRSQSTLITGPSINYVERPVVSSLTHNQISTLVPQKAPTPPVINANKLQEYIADIYGTARSIQSSSSGTTHQDIRSVNNSAVTNATYISAFRYMQSSVNRDLFQEYRNAY